MAPKKRARLGRISSSQAKRRRETSEERLRRLEVDRNRASTTREEESPAARQARLGTDRARDATTQTLPTKPGRSRVTLLV
jgi:hypothetical protein